MLKIVFTVNIILLILHEMDAIYWKEWRIFGVVDDLTGRNGFLFIHIPLFMILLFTLIYSDAAFGWVVSLFISSFLIVHYFLHRAALAQGLFDEKASFGIISAMLIVSIFQITVTVISRFIPALR